MRLLLILLLVLSLPLLELYVLILTGSAIGPAPTLLPIAATMLLGAYALQHQGLGVLGRMQRSMDCGLIPTGGMFESLFIVAGGLLLILPGFITDLVGVLCLIPPLRRLILLNLLKRIY